MNFEDLGLSPELVAAVAACGYETPTPIQAQAIPSILMTRDVVGLAQTGTGKTAGFILPMIDILADGRAKMRMPRSLVLEPTRELAAQVAANFDLYGKNHKLTKALLVGGESVAEQQRILNQNVDVLIATPGRLIDLFERGTILLNDIKILVIDEADRMMDMGFIPDIEKIVGLLPRMRQTLFFSATMSAEIDKLSAKFLSNPKRVEVTNPSSAATTVEQKLMWVHPKDKKNALSGLIKDENVSNAFIFCNRKRDVGDLAKWLKMKGFNAEALHGDMAQKSRYEVLGKFKNDEITLLVCSDVAARGLDVKGVSHVFNYDVPMNAEDYIHRIGRTGRAGMTGHAWSLASKHDTKFVDAIEKLIGNKIDAQDFNQKSQPINNPKKTEYNKPEHKKPQHKKQERKQEHKQEHQQEQKQKRRQAHKQDRVQSKKEISKAVSNTTGDKGFGDEMPDFFK